MLHVDTKFFHICNSRFQWTFTHKIVVSFTVHYVSFCKCICLFLPFFLLSTVMFNPFSRLHNILGSGLPLALHINDMFSPSRTATVEAELSSSTMFGGTVNKCYFYLIIKTVKSAKCTTNTLSSINLDLRCFTISFKTIIFDKKLIYRLCK